MKYGAAHSFLNYYAIYFQQCSLVLFACLAFPPLIDPKSLVVFIRPFTPIKQPRHFSKAAG